MQYQLIIQFPQEMEGGLDRLVDIEDELWKILPASVEVDGHDFGSGQMNIFILTKDPLEIFSKIKEFLEKDTNLLAESKVAYRDVQKNDFTVLWPADLKNFKIT